MPVPQHLKQLGFLPPQEQELGLGPNDMQCLQVTGAAYTVRLQQLPKQFYIQTISIQSTLAWALLVIRGFQNAETPLASGPLILQKINYACTV